MKKLMMICGLLFGMVAFAQAQQDGGRPNGRNRMGMSPEARLKALDEKLKLSDEQKTKITAIFTAQGETQRKMREEAQAGGADRQAMMEKMQKMRAEVETKVSAVLNDDQKKTYKAMLDEQKAEMEKRMRERQERQERQGNN
jgi:periplasmic protein CpxP/Spy